jgi:serine phosphatase RsbU (regulator of sigma subunit)
MLIELFILLYFSSIDLKSIVMKLYRVVFSLLLIITFFPNSLGKDSNIDSLLKVLDNTTEDTTKIKIDVAIATAYLQKFNYDSTIIFCLKAIELNEGKDFTGATVRAYWRLGLSYYRKGIIDKALKYYLTALDVAKSIKSNLLPDILNEIGVLYKSQGNYQKAIECFQQNLEYFENKKDTGMIGYTLNNMANVYYMYGIYSKSIEYYERSIEIFRKLNKQNYVGYLLINLGISYKKLKENSKALESFRESQEIFKKLKLNTGLAQANGEIGTFYAEEGNYTMALKYQDEALKVYLGLGEKMLIAYAYQAIGETYQKSNAYSTSLNYYQKSLKLFMELNAKKEMIDNYQKIASIYSMIGDHKKAYDNLKNYSSLKDSTLSDDFLKQMQEMEAKYENSKKENEIKLQKAEISKKESEAKRKNIFMIAVGLIALMVIGFSVVIFKQYAEKKKANVLLAEQNDKITKQHDQIFQQKKEITDSIHYASRIQRAVLPSPKVLEDYGIQYFVLYKPRDIVSGDFYWINQKDTKVMIAAADCTGHGVPGAFMSMLGMAFLNEIVTKGEFNNPAQVLDQLRNLIVKSLHQSGSQGETKDGMDIALCMIDKDKNEVQYAGAFNSMYLIRGEELIEGPADRMPVGFHDKLGVPFTNTVLQLQKGDSLYIFSDGYIDQFGGENGKKFMAKKFKQLLLGLQDKAMEEQREILDRTTIEWRGELDQVDDVLVIGMRV